jgi:hypothetical protein
MLVFLGGLFAVFVIATTTIAVFVKLSPVPINIPAAKQCRLNIPYADEMLAVFRLGCFCFCTGIQIDNFVFYGASPALTFFTVWNYLLQIVYWGVAASAYFLPTEGKFAHRFAGALHATFEVFWSSPSIGITFYLATSTSVHP